MKIKHYFAFEKELSQKFCDDMLNEKNWDILRMDERDSAFAIEKDIESYEQNCRNAQSYKNAAQKICDILRQENLINKRIISLGAGKGILEWHLKKKHARIIYRMYRLYIECGRTTKKGICSFGFSISIRYVEWRLCVIGLNRSDCSV